MNGMKYYWNGCKRNKILVQSNDKSMTKSVLTITKVSILITKIYNIIFGWSLDNKTVVDTISTYNNWTVV